MSNFQQGVYPSLLVQAQSTFKIQNLKMGLELFTGCPR